MQFRIQRLQTTDTSHAAQHAAGEALAAEMLSEACGVPADAIVFHRDGNGKPYTDLPLQFSISHTDDRVFCAVHPRAVGADIERIRPPRAGVVRRVCQPAEAAYVGDDPRRFAEVWTRKEAYAKLDGRGLAFGLQNIETADENGLTPTVCGCKVITAETDGYIYTVVWKE